MKKPVILTTYFIALSLMSTPTEAQESIVHIAKYKGDKTCAISYTFDDGMAEHYSVAVPKLEQFGFRGTFWICGAWFSNDDNVQADTTKLSWAQCREMAAAGHEISNHAWSHKNLPQVPLEVAADEIRKNDSIIHEKLGFVPTTFCYPFNAFNEEVLKMASKNRVGTRTQQFDVGSKSTPEILDRHIARVLETGEWGVAMGHGISYGYDAFKVPAIFWDHLEKVKKLEDRIWVGTFREVAAYIKERDAIQLQVTPSKKGWTVVPQLSLDKNLFTEPLTAVIDKPGVKKTTVRQGKKKLDVRHLSGKVLFDFDPHGGPIQIEF